MRSYRFETELAQDGLGSLHFEVEVDRVDGEPEMTGVSLAAPGAPSVEIPLKHARTLLGAALFDSLNQQAVVRFQDDAFYDGEHANASESAVAGA